METIDLQFFLEPPNLTVKGLLTIEALAPLSMVAAQPGFYFRTQSQPTNGMVYGMLENALGWHFGEKQRVEIIRGLLKEAKRANKSLKLNPWYDEKPPANESGFVSLLSTHLKLMIEEIQDELVLEYDDLWSQQLHDEGANFMGGSKNFDYRINELLKIAKEEDTSLPKNPKTKKHPPMIEFGESTEHIKSSLEDALKTTKGKIHFKSVRSAYPWYYTSPKLRGYVIPLKSANNKGDSVVFRPYKFMIETTATLANILTNALKNPAAPLYLGTNDGWVEATLEW
jgi:CRISPR-associated protein Cas5